MMLGVLSQRQLLLRPLERTLFRLQMLSNPLVMKEVLGGLTTSKTKCDLEPINHKINSCQCLTLI